MNQIQRDLTYRLDAVKSVCGRYGQESEICQQSIQLWESQHTMNIFNARMFLYIKLAGGALIIFILGIYFYSYFLKLKTKNTNA